MKNHINVLLVPIIALSLIIGTVGINAANMSRPVDMNKPVLVVAMHKALSQKSRLAMLGVFVWRFRFLRLGWAALSSELRASARANAKNGGFAAENWKRWAEDNKCPVAYEVAVAMENIRTLNKPVVGILKRYRDQGYRVCVEGPGKGLNQLLGTYSIGNKPATEIFDQVVSVDYSKKPITLPSQPEFWHGVNSIVPGRKILISSHEDDLKAAQEAGFEKGILFKDHNQLEKDLAEMGNLNS